MGSAAPSRSATLSAPRPAPRPTRALAGRLPRPRPLPKAADAGACEQLEQLPNIGPSMASELRRIGIVHPRELASRDGYALYRALCEASGKRQDPCVLDTFLAIVDFMRGAAPAPWWHYTARRKAQFGDLPGAAPAGSGPRGHGR